jgi:hypothetical protein
MCLDMVAVTSLLISIDSRHAISSKRHSQYAIVCFFKAASRLRFSNMFMK